MAKLTNDQWVLAVLTNQISRTEEPIIPGSKIKYYTLHDLMTYRHTQDFKISFPCFSFNFHSLLCYLLEETRQGCQHHWLCFHPQRLFFEPRCHQCCNQKWKWDLKNLETINLKTNSLVCIIIGKDGWLAGQCNWLNRLVLTLFVAGSKIYVKWRGGLFQPLPKLS